MDFLLAGNRFSLTGKGLLPGVDVQRRYLWKTFRAEAEQDSGVGQKVFGFGPEFVFAFNPERCSESAGILFGFTPEWCSACPGIRSRATGRADALSQACPTASSKRLLNGALLGSSGTFSTLTPHFVHFTRYTSMHTAVLNSLHGRSAPLALCNHGSRCTCARSRSTPACCYRAWPNA
jgi:hypothetical protein